MAGFDNEVVYGSNVDFTGNTTVNATILTNGQLIIGSTALNAGGTHINIGMLISPLNTISIGYATPNITLDVNGSAVGQTITGDSGGPLSPVGGNWNIFGRSGSKTDGSGNTLTVRSPPYSDQGANTTVTLNSGSFATAAITLTTPASAGLVDGDLIEFVATNGVLVIQLAATQVAHLGSATTSVAGTITGTATGDSISLRYQASTNDWWATSSIGIWVLA